MEEKQKEETEYVAEATVEKGEDVSLGAGSESISEATLLEGEQPGAPVAKEVESEVKAKTGRAKRREKRLRHEPQNVTVEEGPSGVHILDFAEARATELSSMVKALRSKGGSKRIFQLLPRHMRRRAMSHNVKRLPRRLRSQAEKQMDKSKTTVGDVKKKPKRLSRKQRRKTSRMKLEYERRQRRHKWLETHIWHAKRMKMCDKYGYKIAEHCSDKGIRQAYMSLTHGCLISDISYYCCTEISGEQSNIVSSLSPLFSKETGLTIKAKAFLCGQREGKAVMYRPGAYPYGAIGPVQFLWQAPPPAAQVGAVSEKAPPTVQSASANVPGSKVKVDGALEPSTPPIKLWIWCHPAIHETVLEEIQKAADSFNRSSASSREQARDVSSGSGSVPASDSVTVESLKLDLVRFRLIGPRSHALLMETLRPVLNFDEAMEEGKEVSGADSATVDWWDGELRRQLSAHSDCLSRVLPSIKSLSSPAHICKGSVIGMTVLDPRLFTPSKRTDKVSAYYPKKKNGYLLQRPLNKRGNSERNCDLNSDSESSVDEGESGVEGDASDMEEGEVPDLDFPPTLVEQTSVHQRLSTDQQVSTHQLDFQQHLAFSLIWDRNVRKIVSQSRMPDHILNLQRMKQLAVPSLEDLQKKASKIPVLLVQQSFGSSHQGSGWDIILPSNWAMAFWVSLIYRGARACGMTELRKCALETQALHFPSDYPDTVAGEKFGNEQKLLLEAKYRRCPPDKRRNYGKLLIGQPFCCCWSNVVTAWSQEFSLNCSSSLLSPPSKRMKLSSKQQGEEDAEPELFENVLDYEEQNHSEGDSHSRKRCLGDTISTAKNEISYSQESPTCYVLRSHNILNSLRHFVEFVFSQKKKPNQLRGDFTFSSSGVSMEPSRFYLASLQQFEIDEHLHRHSSALLAVKFETHQRGTITDRAAISLPSSKDLEMFTASCGKRKAFSGPKEEINQRGLTIVDGDRIYTGVSSLCRKEIKKVKSKRSDQLKSKSDEQNKNNTDGQMAPSQSSLNPTAWEEFRLQPVRPSRMEIGYATLAGYRLSTSHFSGVGFCTFAGLVEMIRRCFLTPGLSEPIALVRGENIQYWFIKVELL